MPEEEKTIRSSRLGPRLEAWALAILTRPPFSRLTCVAVVVAYVMVVGYFDYVTGTSISMQLFYLGPISLALAWLGFRAAFFTSVLAIVIRLSGDYIQGAEYTRGSNLVWNASAFLAMYMVVVWVLHSLIKLRRELESRVQVRTAALAREVIAREKLQQELVEISERERRRIGNDLHDGLGQHLTAMAFAAQVLSQQLTDKDDLAAVTAREIVRLAEEGILQSRQLARGLLLSAIEPGSLNRELEQMVVTVQEQTGVRCHFEPDPTALAQDSTIASNIFRIAEEAVRNSIRHAQPTAVNLSLSNDRLGLLLSVSDNGAGMPATVRKEAGVGLRVMAQRAKLMGGDFVVESDSGTGTRIRCRVPLTAGRVESFIP